MTQKDLNRLAQREIEVSAMLEKRGCSGVQDLLGFPFASLEDVVEMCRDYGFSVVVPYNADLIEVFGTISEQRLTVVFSWIVYAIILGNVALALFNHQWSYVVGALFAVASMFFSSPHNRWRRAISGLMFVALLGLGLVSWKWATLPASYLLVTLLTDYIRLVYQQAITNRVLRSEPFLCYMYLKRIIMIYHKEQDLTCEAAPWAWESMETANKETEG